MTIGCDGVTHQSFDAVEVSVGPEPPFLREQAPRTGKYWAGGGEEGHFLFLGGGLFGDYGSVGIGAGLGAPTQNYFPVWGGAF